MTQNQHSTHKSKIYEEPLLLKTANKQTPGSESEYNPKYVLEFLSKHHLNSLWEAFIYEKNHPKIPLSATEVLAMINLPPDEQDQILKEHEYS